MLISDTLLLLLFPYSHACYSASPAQENHTTHQPLICCVQIILQPLPFHKGEVVEGKKNTHTFKKERGEGGMNIDGIH